IIALISLELVGYRPPLVQGPYVRRVLHFSDNSPQGRSRAYSNQLLRCMSPEMGHSVGATSSRPQLEVNRTSGLPEASRRGQLRPLRPVLPFSFLPGVPQLRGIRAF